MILFLLKKVLNLFPYYKYTYLLIRLLKLYNTLFMAEKGILSKADEKWLAEFMDKAIKLKGIAEVIDGAVFKVLLASLDNILVEKYVPEDWKNPIEELIELGKKKDKPGIAGFLNKHMDLPFLDEDSERLAFEYLVKFIAVKMYSYIDSVEG